MPSNFVLTGLANDLSRHTVDGCPVRNGLIGSGKMGTDIIIRAGMMNGVCVAAISEHELSAVHKAIEIARRKGGHSTVVSNADALNTVIENGKTAVSDKAAAILEPGLTDVVTDAAGLPATSAEIGLDVMEPEKDLVMKNVEPDVTIGAYLRREEDKLGVVYSPGAGDEPSACGEQIELISAMGHRIVCAGGAKNNRLNFDYYGKSPFDA